MWLVAQDSIVNVRRRDCGVAERHRNLIESPDHVANGVKPRYGRLEMLIDHYVAVMIAIGPQTFCYLGAHITTHCWIQNVDPSRRLTIGHYN